MVFWTSSHTYVLSDIWHTHNGLSSPVCFSILVWHYIWLLLHTNYYNYCTIIYRIFRQFDQLKAKVFKDVVDKFSANTSRAGSQEERRERRTDNQRYKGYLKWRLNGMGVYSVQLQPTTGQQIINSWPTVAWESRLRFIITYVWA